MHCTEDTMCRTNTFFMWRLKRIALIDKTNNSAETSRIKNKTLSMKKKRIKEMKRINEKNLQQTR